MILRLMVIATFITVVALDSTKFGQSMKPEAIKFNQSMSMKLATEYKDSKLEDVSSDGKRLLFFSTSKWIRSNTFQLYGTPPLANKMMEKNDDVLRVVDFASGREVARTPVVPFPYHSEFMPDTSVVFFSENANETAAGTHQKLWDVDSNNITRCLDKKQISLNQGEGGVSIIGAINSKTILEKIWQRESGDILVTMSLPDCRMTRVGPISASDANIRFSGLNNSYSLSGENIALATREQTVVVRDTRTLDIKKEINAPADLRLGEQVIFTPDGKFLITLASNTIGDKPETHRYLLFFETQKYELVRQMDVTAWSPPNLGADAFHESNFIGTVMAISGDGNLIAIGFTRTEKKFQTTMEQAEVVLFDLKTGAEVAKARHPAIKQTRDDPFAARIGKLIFTSDGKYLLSSTHDTLVWELKR